tara:strand:- start:2079 stop:3389 length:1311 start_codon:yes stop_codon:yes gene_type:complete
MINTAAQYALYPIIALVPFAMLIRHFERGARGRERLVVIVVGGQGAFLALSLFAGGGVGLPTGSALILSRVGWFALVSALAVGLLLVRSTGPSHPQARAVRITLLAVIGSQALSALASGGVPTVNVFLPSVLVAVVLTGFSMPSFESATRVAQVAVMLPVGASMLAFLSGLAWSTVAASGRRVPSPFMDERLTGVLAHPNGLAPLASLGVILAVSRWSRVQVLPLLVSLFVLWGTDTRTMILITPVAVAPILARRLNLPTAIRSVAMFFAAGLILTAAGLWLNENGRASDDVLTVNGRTVVWGQAVVYLGESPLFGVGDRAFDIAYRASSGLTYAGQAHNQLFQTMAAEGLVGLVALAALFLAVGRLTLHERVRSAGLSTAIAIVGLGALATESPLRVSRWSSGLFVLSLFLIVTLALNRRSPSVQARRHVEHSEA